MLTTQIRDINTGDIIAESKPHTYPDSTKQAEQLAKELFATTSEQPHFVYWVTVSEAGYADFRGTF